MVMVVAVVAVVALWVTRPPASRAWRDRGGRTGQLGLGSGSEGLGALPSPHTDGENLNLRDGERLLTPPSHTNAWDSLAQVWVRSCLFTGANGGERTRPAGVEGQSWLVSLASSAPCRGHPSSAERKAAR